MYFSCLVPSAGISPSHRLFIVQATTFRRKLGAENLTNILPTRKGSWQVMEAFLNHFQQNVGDCVPTGTYRYVMYSGMQW